MEKFGKYNRNWLEVFKHAIDGLLYALSSQRNYVIHLTISTVVVFLIFWLSIPFVQSLILIFSITLGLTVEAANTAIEKTVDLVTEEFNPKAKIAKDVAAGMVLISSTGLAIIGFLILFPPLIQKISNL